MTSFKLTILFLLGLVWIAAPAHAAPKRYGSMIHNFEATVAPDAGIDDVTLGYTVGSIWINTTADTAYICADNTNGLAVWKQVDGAGGGASVLSDLTDVTSATQTAGFGLMSDGGNYYGRALVAGDMTPALAGEYFALDSDVGLLVDTSADSVTTTWAPPVAGFSVIKATGSNCSLQINDPTGSVGAGWINKLLTITNSCGGVMTVTINGSDYELNGLTTFTIANGDDGYLLIETVDSGSTWRAYGKPNIADQPSVTPDANTVVPCQSGTASSSVGGYCSAQAVADLGSEEYCVALTGHGDDLTVTADLAALYFDTAVTITDARGYVTTTAPTGASIVIDVNDGGTTIMTTNKIVIEATELTSGTAATQPTLTDTAVAANTKISFDGDQIGSTAAGAGVVACITIIQ